MIDEKKLIEELKEHCVKVATPNSIGGIVTQTIEGCIGIINEQPQCICTRREWYQKGYQDGLKADKWIPCEVELPPQPKENPLYENKPLEIYLVTEKHFGSVSRAFWNGRIFTNGFSKMSVVAWQPLPNPYKKEGAE